MLAHALLNDRADQVEALLQQGADIFAKDRRGQSLLATAVLSGEQGKKTRTTSKCGRIMADAQAKIDVAFGCKTVFK